ncbi:hypothetical protein ACLKA7_006886 [Drosophila subpalustris]
MAADQQDALRLYVTNTKERLRQLLERLQWTEQGVLQKHRQPQAKDKCAEDFDELPPSCMNSTQHSVQLDAALLQQLLGEVKRPSQTFDELQINYSASQKLILYEHVLKCTPRQRVSFEENANFAELVAVTKRAQKKQRRHRKSKPTLHEEMHQLVELQMQALQQQQLQQQQQRGHELRRSRSHELWKTSSSQEKHREQSRKRSSSHEKYRKRSRSQEKRRQRSRSRRPSKTCEQRNQRSRSRSRKRRQRSRSHERHKKLSRSRSHSRRHKRSHYN